MEVLVELNFYSSMTLLYSRTKFLRDPDKSEGFDLCPTHKNTEDKRYEKDTLEYTIHF